MNGVPSDKLHPFFLNHPAGKGLRTILRMLLLICCFALESAGAEERDTIPSMQDIVQDGEHFLNVTVDEWFGKDSVVDRQYQQWRIQSTLAILHHSADQIPEIRLAVECYQTSVDELKNAIKKLHPDKKEQIDAVRIFPRESRQAPRFLSSFVTCREFSSEKLFPLFKNVTRYDCHIRMLLVKYEAQLPEIKQYMTLDHKIAVLRAFHFAHTCKSLEPRYHGDSYQTILDDLLKNYKQNPRGTPGTEAILTKNDSDALLFLKELQRNATSSEVIRFAMNPAPLELKKAFALAMFHAQSKQIDFVTDERFQYPWRQQVDQKQFQTQKKRFQEMVASDPDIKAWTIHINKQFAETEKKRQQLFQEQTAPLVQRFFHARKALEPYLKQAAEAKRVKE